jgi:hypothetical protein
MNIAPDSPNRPRLCARQSKTMSGESHYPSRPAADRVATLHCRLPRQIRRHFQTTIKENEMGFISGRKLLLGAVIASSVGIGYAIGAQPHMEATLGILQSARVELAKATPNKGGHRERALGLIDQAINEVRAGMAFAGD